MPNYESRSTIYLADPRTLAVDWKKNLSRDGTEPPIDDSLISLAHSMMPKDSDASGSSGQIHPILCRTATKDGAIAVIGGYRRLQAALYLVKSGLCPDYKIKYTTSRLSDLEAALANMDENMQREDPQPMQLARAVRKLTEDYGMTLDVVAGRLKRSAGYLNRLLDLVMLPEPIQASISAGETTVTAGIQLARLPESDQVSVFNEVKAEVASRNPDGKVHVAAVKKAARRKSEEKATATPSADSKPIKARAIKRSLKEVESFLEDRASIGEPDSGKLLANAILDFIDGKATDEETEKSWLRATR